MNARDSEARARTKARLAAVRARFADGLDERLSNLSGLALVAAGPDAGAAAAACESLRLGLHNLSGSAPTIGFVELGVRAGALEARMMALRSADGRLGPDAADEIAREIAGLAKLGG